MSQAGKVAEIFSLAGETFTRLGILATSLQSSNTDGGKWDDEEIDMLRKAIGQFGNDIEKISEKIKTKSAMQIKNTLKQKAMQNFNVAPTMRTTNVQKPVVANETQNIVVKTPVMNTVGQNVGSRPPGLQHIAAKPAVMTQPVQNPVGATALAMKPTMMTIQGQNFAVKQNMISIPTQQNIIRPPIVTIAGQTLVAKPTGMATPVSIITPQTNKSPLKIQNVSRSIGQKTKMDTISVSGMMSLADVQNATKKVKLDSPNLNILTSALLNQKPMIRSQTPGIPGIVSSQGFQVLMPSSARPAGIVQRVVDVNTIASNVDIES